MDDADILEFLSLVFIKAVHRGPGRLQVIRPRRRVIVDCFSAEHVATVRRPVLSYYLCSIDSCDGEISSSVFFRAWSDCRSCRRRRHHIAHSAISTVSTESTSRTNKAFINTRLGYQTGPPVERGNRKSTSDRERLGA